MKKIILTLLAVLVIAQLHAQSLEVSVQANTGLFRYSGSSATNVSFISQEQSQKQNYTNNPYGSLDGFSYGGGADVRYTSKNGFLLGLQTGYEILRSKVNINGYYTFGFVSPGGPVVYDILRDNNEIQAKGQTFLEDQSIDLNPYVGYRLKIRKIKIDLMPGIDLGFNVSSYDKGIAAASDGTTVHTDFKRADAPVDVRLKFGLAASYNRFGVTGSYSHGLTNYTSGLFDNYGYAEKVRSEIFRFGISYRLF